MNILQTSDILQLINLMFSVALFGYIIHRIIYFVPDLMKGMVKKIKNKPLEVDNDRSLER